MPFLAPFFPFVCLRVSEHPANFGLLLSIVPPRLLACHFHPPPVLQFYSTPLSCAGLKTSPPKEPFSSPHLLSLHTFVFSLLLHPRLWYVTFCSHAPNSLSFYPFVLRCIHGPVPRNLSPPLDQPPTSGDNKLPRLASTNIRREDAISRRAYHTTGPHRYQRHP